MKIIKEINKKYGEGTAILAEEGSEPDKYFNAIPTGSIRLDVALGIGGLPRGRIIEIFGPESAGKTTLCLSIISQCQSMGGRVAFIDMEHALDPDWVDKCGVSTTTMATSQPDTGEQALDIVEMFLRSNEVDLIVVDSVAALVPRAEIEGEMGDSHVGLQARLMSQSMRKLTSAIKTSDASVIFTNQLRQKIGVTWGNPETTTGGEALKFYASIRLDLRKNEIIKEKDEAVSNKVKVTVKKNKVGPPFKVTEFEIDYESGLSRVSEIIELGVSLGLIDKAGAGWFTIEGQKIQGSNNLKSLLSENLTLALSLENKIREHYGLPIKVVE